MKIVDADGRDSSAAVLGGDDRRRLLRPPPTHGVEVERQRLRGPSDEELLELRKDPNYRPAVAIASHQSRVEWEIDAQRVLNNDPKWRRGRLRDFVAAREFVHEWNDMLARMRVEGVRSGLPAFEPGQDKFRSFLSSMPHTQVAVSIKTQKYKNPRHTWTPNGISDIDAMSVAYAYCEAVFPTRPSVTRC
ncbi:hypothetical protein IM660_03420 [Ruania alkalisoli]|uniref:Uncharacterized protein n=1 Tax=Ruania alkalisoli TaxID=2779775 RepID=A0A7M1SXA6_9MICO|nr:hypothetical protein [Ruania alkalisoli]QOR71362.1 hypothetical protein IM660_03420 [Ruania alkalisoli]